MARVRYTEWRIRNCMDTVAAYLFKDFESFFAHNNTFCTVSTSKTFIELPVGCMKIFNFKLAHLTSLLWIRKMVPCKVFPRHIVVTSYVVHFARNFVLSKLGLCRIFSDMFYWCSVDYDWNFRLKPVLRLRYVYLGVVLVLTFKFRQTTEST